ncbi:L-seryl-tRNA(Sec) selenium transferase, partial [Flavonifractor plautii]|uniref:L-seryl-tRNA(Sec) selenium transferase n=2 Tax=Flavonifractor TaxID=946234 RepID=UPI003DA4A637
MKPELLRALPKMDLLLARPALAGSPLPYALRRQAARQVLDEYRAALRAGALSAVPGLDELEQSVLRRGAELARPALGRVINATGVVLHTNLGRAPLSPRAAAAVGEAARGYSNLEYDLSARRRGRRGAAVESLLCALTGAEAALVVNNNAAAVFLLLSALAAGRGVAISRGELVEIGGGFRVPDILARSGARLVEVGTTNKTRPADYAAALDAGEAQVLLKVHPSNFRVVGFTQAVSLPELGALARERGVPLFCDLGSAAPGSPELAEAVAWADVCCFSGDKLLGGPQAGILLGKAEPLGRLRADPLSRALRPGKLALAALEATLLDWRDGTAVPVSAMLSAPPEELRRRAEALAEALSPLHPCTAV